MTEQYKIFVDGFEIKSINTLNCDKNNILKIGRYIINKTKRKLKIKILSVIKETESQIFTFTPASQKSRYFFN